MVRVWGFTPKRMVTFVWVVAKAGFVCRLQSPLSSCNCLHQLVAECQFKFVGFPEPGIGVRSSGAVQAQAEAHDPIPVTWLKSGC